MTGKKQSSTMTDVLRQKIREAPSVNSVAKGVSVSHSQLLRFLSGERDLQLSTADRLATFFRLALVAIDE